MLCLKSSSNLAVMYQEVLHSSLNLLSTLINKLTERNILNIFIN